MRLVHVVSFASVALVSALTIACSSGNGGSGGPPVGTPSAADGGAKAPDKLTSGKLGAITGSKPDTTKDAGAKPEPNPGPDPAPTCGSAALCVNECPDEGGDTCIDACLAHLDEAEFTKLQTVASCLGESGCAEGDDACVQEVCGSAIQSCIGG